MSETRAALLAALFGLTGCVTDVELGANSLQLTPQTPRTVSVEGELCTPVVTSPIRIVIALDGSQSMLISDPSGSRGQAVVDLLDTLPQDPAISVAVLVFRGSTLAWLTLSGLPEFDRVVDYSPAAKNLLSQRILNFASPGSDPTDFAAPLSDIYSVVSRDIAQRAQLQGLDETRARYSVVFLSDGAPTTNQDTELLCGDAVRRIAQLRDLADEVTVNTVHVFAPTLAACPADAGVVTQPTCGLAVLPPGTCALEVVDQNAQRLALMAGLGGGTFSDFRGGAPVALNLAFAPVRRRLVFDKLVASNLSAPAGSPAGVADSDLDGLIDSAELTEGTLPSVADTDGDGFSDGVEVTFRALGSSFSPTQVDPGCPAQMRGLDNDCDGLMDCDEQLIGTSSAAVDTDADGIADAVEYQLGSQPAARDLTSDPDNDSLLTGVELTSHLDPRQPDPSPATSAYVTEVTAHTTREADGSQCWNFQVSNITRADTLDGGAGSTNELFLSWSMRWEDKPTGRTFLRTFRHTTAPTQSVVSVARDGFLERCRPANDP